MLQYFEKELGLDLLFGRPLGGSFPNFKNQPPREQIVKDMLHIIFEISPEIVEVIN